jgi:hypothetical protein
MIVENIESCESEKDRSWKTSNEYSDCYEEKFKDYFKGCVKKVNNNERENC